jgi:hypothetical protein
MDTISRYDEKPLLRLLELYVLWAIGEIDQHDLGRLESMAPKLQSIFGGEGQWHGAIAAAVHLPPSMPIVIRDLWLKNLEIARKTKTSLAPQQFAEMFVDENLVASPPQTVMRT